MMQDRYEPSEEETMAIAQTWHGSETDWGGRPYVEHLKAVRDLLGPEASEAERKAALLHDVLEDTAATSEALRGQGISDEVITIVELLTAPKAPRQNLRGMTRAEVLAQNERAYEARIDKLLESGNVSAWRVKLADNRHNSDPERDRLLTDPRDLERALRFRHRYARSAARLREAIQAIEGGKPSP